MEKLTINKAQELLGKTIEWTAPAAEENANYGGKAIITVIKDSIGPLIAKIIEGDDLNYAVCVDKINIDFIGYGKGVMFRVIDQSSAPDITANEEAGVNKFDHIAHISSLGIEQIANILKEIDGPYISKAYLKERVKSLCYNFNEIINTCKIKGVNDKM